MSIPTMYYAGLVSNLLFLVLLIFGFIYIFRKTGRKYLFLILFAAAWFVSALSYIFLIASASTDVWYLTIIRIISYILFLVTIASLIVELTHGKQIDRSAR